MARYIGLMSGTSMDGVDAILADIPDHDGALPRLEGTHSHPMPTALLRELEALTREGDDELTRMARADSDMGRLFADASLALLAKLGVPSGTVRAIGSHGQTIRHYPELGQSLQLGDPNRIAELTGITTVADFRRRDMAAGGQGAPLVPAFHQAAFQRPDRNRVVLNIGGIANITVLPGAIQTPVTGFDTGPGNTLLDAWARRHTGQVMDRAGAWAGGGRSNPALLERLLADPYFPAPPPKSTGREYFDLAWLEGHLATMKMQPAPQDVQATLVQLTAGSIAQAMRKHTPDTAEILVCGGGVHNPALMSALAAALPGLSIESSATAGIHPDWVEAMAFAWLAARAVHGLPGNLPAVTGASHPVVLGGIYPGQGHG